ncbi:MAG: D-alanyl-D-alanine carboxypeptidase, partial [Acidobacteriaceae bacterium]|nr:D-alanyl-D-alanine carboxypeptidase [Acidobacteriaceae bacterium]
MGSKFTRVILTLCIVLLVSAARRRAETLESSIDKAIAGGTEFASAFLGLQVVRLQDGKVLYQRNQNHLFVPASNTKLFATALALSRLGADYRVTTSIVATQKVDEKGILNGDLMFVGRGDPTMSCRPYPYTKDWTRGPHVPAIEDLAEQLVTGGLKSVQGDIVGDDTRYPWDPFPGGWNIDDGVWEYGA